MTSTTTHCKVLVVSPAGPLSEAVSARLAAAGHDIERVDPGEAALRRVALEPVAAALLCCASLTAADWEVAGDLRLLSPTLAVLVISPDLGTDSGPSARDASVDAVVPVVDGEIPAGLIEAALCGALVLRGAGGARPGATRAGAPSRVRPHGEAIARLVHDLNQPLTVVLGTVEVLLMDADLATPARDDLDTLRQEADRLRVIAGELRTLVHELRQSM